MDTPNESRGHDKPDFRFSFIKGWRLAALELDLKINKGIGFIYFPIFSSTG